MNKCVSAISAPAAAFLPRRPVATLPEFGSFTLPRMPVRRQRVAELALLIIIAIVLPIACLLRV